MSIKLRHYPADALRWLKNNPAFNFYVLLIFPLGASVFVQIVRSPEIPNFFTWDFLKTHWYMGGVLLIFLAIGLIAAFDDLNRKFVEPYMFRDHHDALLNERWGRNRLRVLRRRLQSQEPGEEKTATVLTEFQEKVSKDYSRQFRAFKNLRGLKKRGSICAWITLMLNSLIGVFVAGAFFCLSVIVVSQTGPGEQITLTDPDLDKLLAVSGLLVLWFPIRIYSDWYLHFYSLRWLKQYYTFWFLLVFANVAYLFVFIKAMGGNLDVKSFSLIGSGLLALLGIIGKLKPAWLRYGADVVESMPARWYLASVFIVGFGFIITTFVLLDLLP
ncbi:MAG: hypothetical protein ACYTAQ_05060 [Planctomycetota bacterium]